MSRLPRVVQDIADVIGRERALFLIGQLPCCFVRDRRGRGSEAARGSRRVILYVPKTLRPDHLLVRVLGWHDAAAMVREFGGEIICPPTMRDVVYRPFRDAAIVSMQRGGLPVAMLAEWFGMSERRVRQLAELAIPQEELGMAANDNAPSKIRASA